MLDIRFKLVSSHAKGGWRHARQSHLRSLGCTGGARPTWIPRLPSASVRLPGHRFHDQMQALAPFIWQTGTPRLQVSGSASDTSVLITWSDSEQVGSIPTPQHHKQSQSQLILTDLL